MLMPIAIRLVALLEVAGLEDQVPIFNSQPDMFARVTIAPFEE
jgi:hypothetical protein